MPERVCNGKHIDAASVDGRRTTGANWAATAWRKPYNLAKILDVGSIRRLIKDMLQLIELRFTAFAVVCVPNSVKV